MDFETPSLRLESINIGTRDRDRTPRPQLVAVVFVKKTITNNQGPCIIKVQLCLKLHPKVREESASEIELI